MQGMPCSSSIHCSVFRVQIGIWPVGLAVKTEASHASNMGSIPVRVTTVGVFNGEGPPVPIPNTEVKLTGAEDTCLATDWKNRSMPTQKA